MNKPCLAAKIPDDHTFNIGQSRQFLAETFMATPEATHLLFVDDDIAIPDPKCLIRMFQFLDEFHEVIVSGLYYEKYAFHNRCDKCGLGIHRPLIFGMQERDGKLYFRFGEKPPNANVVKVGCVPAGFLLIKREALEKIPKPWFVYGDAELDRMQVVKAVHPPGEDVYFSWKAQKAGLSLWVDTRADLLHFVPNWVGSRTALEFAYARDANLAAALSAMKREHSTETVKAP